MPSLGQSGSSPARPLERLLRENLTVEDIVSEQLWSVSGDTKCVAALTRMEQYDYDIAGVVDSIDHDSQLAPSHFVLRTALAEPEGTVARRSRPIEARMCVEKSLPLAYLLEILRDKRVDRLFVLDGDRIRWVVNRADLDTPAVSVTVLAMLAGIEIGLKELSADIDVVAMLTPARRIKIGAIFDDLVERGLATNDRDCLYFYDWMTILEKFPILQTELGFDGRRGVADFTRSFDATRNDAAHGRGLFADKEHGKPRDAVEVLDRIGRIRELSTRIWDLVQSRETSDSYIKTTIRDSVGLVLAGEGAVAMWPHEPAAHVLTAHNPGGFQQSGDLNDQAALDLEHLLRQRSWAYNHVVGSADRGRPDWVEGSFLVVGAERPEIASIARLFRQSSFFELTTNEQLLVDSRSLEVTRHRSRIQ